ncbi:urea ABC transporter ATP-binding subunit UrtE [Frankia sp. AgB1.9]|uniref:urea ABC transporter ATP-binding subunit UrtE n=1 Tax=unclassified Frankia TaxID=2632575 RepID=UPI001933985D|nr:MULTISPECIES: urea ABC transporter ATP-binding subunit UrtE [unclassified Frankia]MBL7491787.1 urea ABC transporter ATP-binding subunit UrtE [Frankia sp. AgW1.1]MBL7550682.1 urea ABC transporter ATP-binding subunit UrtE [Frankia sp. AgB1.9]MBL7621659.1 urea ABC transporter ATP-binding subunit UrtE [Frankia sp. AgB1.8]
MTDDLMLRVTSLDVGYGRAQVLFGVSLEVPRGSLVCVMGRNGVGKTTLLNALLGVLSPSAGKIEFDGKDVTKVPTYSRVRRGMGYCPQGHETFPQLTVYENLQVTWEAAKGKKGAIDEALDVFPRLKPFLRRRAGFLSGGQQQMLAMARALVTGPRMLILDEPTEGIQPSIVAEIEEVIERLHKEVGLAILLVEQYVDTAIKLADSFIVLDAGLVAHAGTAADLQNADLVRLLAV